MIGSLVRRKFFRLLFISRSRKEIGLILRNKFVVIHSEKCTMYGRGVNYYEENCLTYYLPIIDNFVGGMWF